MSWLPWFVIVVLTILNALYVAAEFSVVAVQRSEVAALASQGRSRAQRLLQLLSSGPELDRFIAACQIGITLASLVAGAYAQATISVEIAPLLQHWFGLTPLAAQSTTAIGVLITITSIQVVFGELIPKALALQFPVATAQFTLLPTLWSVKLYRPFIWVLNGTALLALRPFGVSAASHGHVYTPQEIELLLAESRASGHVSPELHRRLARGLQLSSRAVRQLMVPRNKLVAVEVSTPTEALVKLLRESPYSRLPVYRGSMDEVLGAISTKDVVAIYAESRRLPPLESLLAPMPFVPETLPADRLVRFLQEKRMSKAMVVNEFGSVIGLVTIEDVLAEVFGDMGDEIKPDEPEVIELPDGGVKIPGSMALDDAEAWLGRPECDSATTVGGLIMERLGRLPKTGDTLTEGDAIISVTEMSSTVVLWVELRSAEGAAVISNRGLS